MEFANLITDPEGKKIYLNLLSSQDDIDPELITLSFHEMKIHENPRFFNSFIKSRLVWLFKLEDPDFRQFYNKSLKPFRKKFSSSEDLVILSFVDRKITYN